MEWNHAGRHKQVLPKSGRIARDEKDGMRMLAAAVLKQWMEDGKPDDLPKEWVAVLKFLMENLNDFRRLDGKEFEEDGGAVYDVLLDL